MIKTAETYHVPVLLKESVDGLNIQPGGIYVDVTFGGGGHSREILSRLTEGAHLYSFDQDAAEPANRHRLRPGIFHPRDEAPLHGFRNQRLLRS